MNASGVALGIAGHAGIGHTHCPGGLIQDDTAGFAVACGMIRHILGADTRVKSVHVDSQSGAIRVTTMDGGIGKATPRRGVAPAEARLLRSIEGQDAVFCQTLAIEAFGRMYGQGVLETPVALAAALANAALDTFAKVAPDLFIVTPESLSSNSGLIGGIATQINGVTAAVLATVNASSGGIGPNEDLEGNVALGSKRTLMSSLGMLRCPTIVLEGKAFSPALSEGLVQNTFLVRTHKDVDNIVVGEALRDAASELGYPVIFLDEAFPYAEGALKQKTTEVADAIIGVAEALKTAERGADKVRIVAELARLVSQEAGGASFMTDRLHDVVRQCGLIPGTSAVLSMLVTRDYLSHWKIPLLEQDDIDMMTRIVFGAVTKIAARLEEANGLVNRLYVDLAPLEREIT